MLETENRAAAPLHDRFQQNLDDLNDRTARIETKVDRLLENGREKSLASRARAYGAPAVGGGGLIAVILVVLERL